MAYHEIEDTPQERQAWIKKYGSLQGDNQFGETYKQYLQTNNRNYGVRQADYGNRMGRSLRTRDLYEIRAETRNGTIIPKKEVTAFGQVGKRAAKSSIRAKAKHKWIKYLVYNVTKRRRYY